MFFDLGAAAERLQVPVLGALADQSHPTRAALSVTLTGSDPDGGSVRFSTSALPAGLVLDPTTGTITVTATTTITVIGMITGTTITTITADARRRTREEFRSSGQKRVRERARILGEFGYGAM